MTTCRVSSGRWAMAHWTACPVPSCSVWRAKRAGSASLTTCFTASAWCPTTTTTRSWTTALAHWVTWRIMGWPPTSWSTLARVDFIRVPHARSKDDYRRPIFIRHHDSFADAFPDASPLPRPNFAVHPPVKRNGKKKGKPSRDGLPLSLTRVLLQVTATGTSPLPWFRERFYRLWASRSRYNARSRAALARRKSISSPLLLNRFSARSIADWARC